MSDFPTERPHAGAIGLCADCQRARRITSSRGSVFYMCTYAEVDPAYPKYPALPVVQCPAYLPPLDISSTRQQDQ